MPHRKASLWNQKQCLCRNWAQWKARAALINRLAPACVTQQEPDSFYNLPLSRQHRWIVSLLQPIKSQTLSKARTQQSPQHRGKKQELCLLSKQVFWSCHIPVLVARRKLVKSFLWRVSGYTVSSHTYRNNRVYTRYRNNWHQDLEYEYLRAHEDALTVE